jgi:hypothetical protein
MPNVKIYVDDTLLPACRDRLLGSLRQLCDRLCEELSVDRAACQFAVISVSAMPELPRVNVEMQILPRPERTRDRLVSVCGMMRDMIGDATGTHVAVRMTALDPETYITLK